MVIAAPIAERAACSRSTTSSRWPVGAPTQSRTFRCSATAATSGRALASDAHFLDEQPALSRPAPGDEHNAGDPFHQIKRLGDLHAAGVLTDEPPRRWNCSLALTTAPQCAGPGGMTPGHRHGCRQSDGGPAL